jgi:DNA-binding transcriptional ArsR family regulator/protein-L-isoaspartate O-methyltransferase
MLVASAADTRCQLYRLLSEPVRLRMLALCTAEELSVGELADLLGESQPNVSRHAAALRHSGLLLDRREGTRVYVQLARQTLSDAVVADALTTGQARCERDGSLGRVAQVVRARDQRTREFFARAQAGADPAALAAELPSYLAALSAAIVPRELAVDAGTGDGAWLDVLCPVFDRVAALDRSEAQLARARRRIAARGYENTVLLHAEIEDAAVRGALGVGADVVVCSRVLHHSPLPRETISALAGLARPGGLILVVDYAPHQDEAVREQQADVWMGFEPAELIGFAHGAGLIDARATPLPSAWVGNGPDSHLDWQVLTARRPPDPADAGQARGPHGASGNYKP